MKIGTMEPAGGKMGDGMGATRLRRRQGAVASGTL